jgi:hypothetical protein
MPQKPLHQAQLGKAALSVLRGLKCALREVLASNLMINTPLCEVLQKNWMLERLAVHQFQGKTFSFSFQEI